MPQQGEPEAQGGAASAWWWLEPFVIVPAPPLMRRWMGPPQDGHSSMAGSDIFCRFSKLEEQESQRYS